MASTTLLVGTLFTLPSCHTYYYKSFSPSSITLITSSYLTVCSLAAQTLSTLYTSEGTENSKQFHKSGGRLRRAVIIILIARDEAKMETENAVIRPRQNLNVNDLCLKRARKHLAYSHQLVTTAADNRKNTVQSLSPHLPRQVIRFPISLHQISRFKVASTILEVHSSRASKKKPRSQVSVTEKLDFFLPLFFFNFFFYSTSTVNLSPTSLMGHVPGVILR